MKYDPGPCTPEVCVEVIADENGVRARPIRHDVRMHTVGLIRGHPDSDPRQVALAVPDGVPDNDTDRAQELRNAVKMTPVFAVLRQDRWRLTGGEPMGCFACLEMEYPSS